MGQGLSKDSSEHREDCLEPQRAERVSAAAGEGVDAPDEVAELKYLETNFRSFAQSLDQAGSGQLPEGILLGRLLGAGCSARVYEGTYHGQPAAIKVLVLDEDTCGSILREVRLAVDMRHPNLVAFRHSAIVTRGPRGQQGPAITNLLHSAPVVLESSNIIPVSGTSTCSAPHTSAAHASGRPSASSCLLGTAPFKSSLDQVQQHLQDGQQQPLDPCLSTLGLSSLHTAAAPLPAPTYDAAPAWVLQQHSTTNALSFDWGMSCEALAPAPGDDGGGGGGGGGLPEVWLVMEYCDGGTLGDQLQQGLHLLPGSGKVDMDFLLRIALGVARALEYMHSRAVCHGDLKSENVLLSVESAPLSEGSISSCQGCCSPSNSNLSSSLLSTLCGCAAGNNSQDERSRRASTDSWWSSLISCTTPRSIDEPWPTSPSTGGSRPPSSPVAASSVRPRCSSSRRRSSMFSASSFAGKLPVLLSTFAVKGRYSRSSGGGNGQRCASHASDCTTGTTATGAFSSWGHQEQQHRHSCLSEPFSGTLHPQHSHQQQQQRRHSCLSEPCSGTLHLQSSQQQRQRRGSCLSETGAGWQLEELEYEWQRRNSNGGGVVSWSEGTGGISGLGGVEKTCNIGGLTQGYGGLNCQQRLSFALVDDSVFRTDSQQQQQRQQRQPPQPQAAGSAEWLQIGAEGEEGAGHFGPAKLEQQWLVQGLSAEAAAQVGPLAVCGSGLRAAAAAAGSSSTGIYLQPQREGDRSMLGKLRTHPQVSNQQVLSETLSVKVSGFWEEEEGCTSGAVTAARSSGAATAGSAATGASTSSLRRTNFEDSCYIQLTEAALAGRQDRCGGIEVEEWILHGVGRPAAVPSNAGGSRAAGAGSFCEALERADKLLDAQQAVQAPPEKVARRDIILQAMSAPVAAAGAGSTSSLQAGSSTRMPPLPPSAAATAAAAVAAGEGRVGFSFSGVLHEASAGQDSSCAEGEVPLGIDEEAEDVGRVSLQQQWEQQQAARRARRMSRRASYREDLSPLLGGPSGPCAVCGVMPPSAAGFMMGIGAGSGVMADVGASSLSAGNWSSMGTGNQQVLLPSSKVRCGGEIGCICGTTAATSGECAGWLRSGRKYAAGAADKQVLQTTPAFLPRSGAGSDAAWGVDVGASAAGTALGSLAEASSVSSASSKGAHQPRDLQLQSAEQLMPGREQTGGHPEGYVGAGTSPPAAAIAGSTLLGGLPSKAGLHTGGWEVYSQLTAAASPWGVQQGPPWPLGHQQRQRRSSMPVFSSSEAAWAWAAAAQRARGAAAGGGASSGRRRSWLVKEGPSGSPGAAAPTSSRRPRQRWMSFLLTPREGRQSDQQQQPQKERAEEPLVGQQRGPVRRRRASASVLEGPDSMSAWKKWCEGEGEAEHEVRYQIAMGCLPLGDTVRAAGAELKEHIRHLSWTAAEAATCCFGNSSSFPSEGSEVQQQEVEMHVPLLAAVAAAAFAEDDVDGSGERAPSSEVERPIWDVYTGRPLKQAGSGTIASSCPSATAAAAAVAEAERTADSSIRRSSNSQGKVNKALSTINSASSQTAPSPRPCSSIGMAPYPGFGTSSAVSPASAHRDLAAGFGHGHLPGFLSHEGSWELDGAGRHHVQQQHGDGETSAAAARARRWSTADGTQALWRGQRKKQEQQEQSAGLVKQASSAAGSLAEVGGCPAKAADIAAAPAGEVLVESAGQSRITPSSSCDLARKGILAGLSELGTARPPVAPTVIAQRRFSYDVATGSYVMGPAKAQHKIESQQQEVQADSYLQQQEDMQLSGTVEHLQEQSIALSSRTASVTSRASGPEAGQHDEQQQQQQHGGEHRGGGHVGRRSTQSSAFSAATDAAAAAAHLHTALTGRHEEEGVLRTGPEGPKPYYVAKLCDFGLSKALSGQSAKQTATMGTITHQPPELLEHGMLGPAADVYAFGILMWEMLMGDLPYHGLYEGDIIVGVLQQGLRPAFPPGAPQDYVQLAQDCWAQDPKARPNIGTVVKRLKGLMAQEAAAARAGEAAQQGRTCRGPRKPLGLRGKPGLHQSVGGQRRRSSFLAMLSGQFGRHGSNGSAKAKGTEFTALTRGKVGQGTAACVSAGGLAAVEQQQWIEDL